MDPRFFEPIAKALEKIGYTLDKPKVLAECILKLSDYYIDNPLGETPWNEKWAQVAYIAYFHPLNYMRALEVTKAGLEVGFFDGLTKLCDFGSGLGAASTAVIYSPRKNPLDILYIESSRVAQKLHFEMTAHKARWEPTLPPHFQGELGIFSYSITELKNPLKILEKFSHLMIIEPATNQDGRKLMELRSKLIEMGFNMWAPCTHQGHCPLLTESKSDWCHHRVKTHLPTWFQEIETFLPIKNKTITFSYLLASKKLCPTHKDVGRLIGDLLEEKGKSKQALCRGPKREFLSWLHKSPLKATDLPRGTVIKIPSHEMVSNEIRPLESIERFDFKIN